MRIAKLNGVEVYNFARFDRHTPGVERMCEACGQMKSTMNGKNHRGRLLRCADCRKPPPVDLIRRVVIG